MDARICGHDQRRRGPSQPVPGRLPEPESAPPATANGHPRSAPPATANGRVRSAPPAAPEEQARAVQPAGPEEQARSVASGPEQARSVQPAVGYRSVEAGAVAGKIGTASSSCAVRRNTTWGWIRAVVGRSRPAAAPSGAREVRGRVPGPGRLVEPRGQDDRDGQVFRLEETIRDNRCVCGMLGGPEHLHRGHRRRPDPDHPRRARARTPGPTSFGVPLRIARPRGQAPRQGRRCRTPPGTTRESSRSTSVAVVTPRSGAVFPSRTPTRCPSSRRPGRMKNQHGQDAAARCSLGDRNRSPRCPAMSR